MQVKDAIEHLELAVRFATPEQAVIFKALGLRHGQHDLFADFCKRVRALPTAGAAHVLCSVFGDEDALHVNGMLRAFEPEHAGCRQAQNGWWVARLIDFDSKLIPRSRHDTKEDAALELRRQVQQFAHSEDQPKLLVIYVPEEV